MEIGGLRQLISLEMTKKEFSFQIINQITQDYQQ